jgi:predicted nucleotidyltransferase
VVKSRVEVLEAIRSKKNQLDSFGVTRIAIFGSAARDELSELSDVDVLVEFAADKMTLSNFMGTKFLLEDAFGRKVDLVTPDSIDKPLLKQEIQKDLVYYGA